MKISQRAKDTYYALTLISIILGCTIVCSQLIIPEILEISRQYIIWKFLLLNSSLFGYFYIIIKLCKKIEHIFENNLTDE